MFPFAFLLSCIFTWVSDQDKVAYEKKSECEDPKILKGFAHF